MSIRNIVLIALFSFILGAGIIYTLDRLPAGSLGASLEAARQSSIDARASADRLRDGLGNLVVDLDGALAEAGKLGDVIARLRARERVYADVAQKLRDIARGLDTGGETPEP
jgi:hypothetical protein